MLNLNCEEAMNSNPNFQTARQTAALLAQGALAPDTLARQRQSYAP